jgi:RHS repeat-associated protein
VVFVQMDQQTIADYPVGGAATTPTFRYVYASYIDEPVVRKGPTSTSTVHFYHRNHQYSVTAITTSTGTIAERYAYTAYGQPTILNASGTVISATTLSNRYSYTGREWDATLGLHHFRARWLSPSAGRFLGRDPIGYEGSEWNLNEYVNSKPLIDIDPSGEFAVPAICATLCLGGIACTAPCLSVCGADASCLFECYSYMSTYGKVVCGGAVVGCAACICRLSPACAVPPLICRRWPHLCRVKPPKPPQPPKPRKRGHSDPHTGQDHNPGGKAVCCNPCQPNSPIWAVHGNAHGTNNGFHCHQIVYNQNPKTCMCFAKRAEVPCPPGIVP